MAPAVKGLGTGGLGLLGGKALRRDSAGGAKYGVILTEGVVVANFRDAASKPLGCPLCVVAVGRNNITTTQTVGRCSARRRQQR